MKKWKIKEQFREILRIKKEPEEIARGFAIGTFFANFPTLGLEWLIIVPLLIFFKKISKISLLSAYVIWNPFITYPLGVLGYLIGNKILGNAPIILIKFTFFQNIVAFTIRYLLGSLILASIFSTISYFVVFYLSERYRDKEIPILQKPLLEE